MKTALKVLFSFLAFLFLVSMPAEQLSAQVNVPVYLTFTVAALVLVIVSFRRQPSGFTNTYRAGIDVEYWVDYIIKRLRKDNKFLEFFFNESRHVVNGAVVHIPQPGAAPAVVKNRSSFPAVAARRTDTDITYTLDEYSTDPVHIQDAEKVQLSYDKIDDVLGDTMAQLTEVVGNDLILKILAALPSTKVVTTTGGASATGLVTGQTGTRKVLLPADVKRIQTLFNLDDVPENDRYMMLESNQLDQLTTALDVNASRDFSRAYDPAKGVIGELYGFKIMQRSTVALAAAAYSGGNLAPLALGAAAGATDDVVSFAWQKNCVSKAMGDVKVFEDINNPLYFGNVYSSLTRMGARRRRADNKGVIAIKGAA